MGYQSSRDNSPRPLNPLIPDILAHVENWRRFKDASSVWPILSITTYSLRFVIMVGGFITAAVFGIRRDWTDGHFVLVSLVVVAAVLIWWFFIERTAWNFDLRRKKLSMDGDSWAVTLFPK